MADGHAQYVTGGEPHGVLRLSRSPLIRVLTQVRWPEFEPLKSDLAEIAQSLGKRLASVYPLVVEEPELAITLTPAGLSQSAGDVIHRYTDVEGLWRVSFAKGFLSLETGKYEDRSDFLSRLAAVLSALTESVQVPAWNRIGYRYTNRITGAEDLDSLQEYFAQPVLGGQLLTLNDGVRLVHSVTESVYRLERNESLLVRSARLGPHQSVDPSLPPSELDSWTFDIDAFDDGPAQTFSPEVVLERVNRLSSIGYQYFREVTTDAFIQRFK